MAIITSYTIEDTTTDQAGRQIGRYRYDDEYGGTHYKSFQLPAETDLTADMIARIPDLEQSIVDRDAENAMEELAEGGDLDTVLDNRPFASRRTAVRVVLRMLWRMRDEPYFWRIMRALKPMFVQLKALDAATQRSYLNITEQQRQKLIAMVQGAYERPATPKTLEELQDEVNGAMDTEIE
jgi:hypothetical protein